MVENASVVALDLEATGLDPRCSAIRLAQVSDGEKIFVVDLFHRDGRPLFESLMLVETGITQGLRAMLGSRWGRQDVRSIEQMTDPLTIFASLEPDVVLRISYDRHRFDDDAAVVAARTADEPLVLLAGDR